MSNTAAENAASSTSHGARGMLQVLSEQSLVLDTCIEKQRQESAQLVEELARDFLQLRDDGLSAVGSSTTVENVAQVLLHTAKHAAALQKEDTPQ